MNQFQRNYILAKADYEAVIAAITKSCEQLGINALYDTDFDAAFDAEEEISSELGRDEAFQFYQEAEQQLVEWSFTIVETHALYKKHFGDLEKLRDLCKRSVVTRHRIAELAMKVRT